MLKKNYLLIVALLLLIVIAVVLFMNKPASQNIEDDITPAENNEEYIPEETMDVEKQGAVFEYLKNNISELSPEKEVLGGTFYITSIDFLDENNLIAGYEDGHIALTAEVEYEYIDVNNIAINSFNIVSK
jgi:hypothetical protein